MLDIKYIRENAEAVKENMKKKGDDPALVDELIQKDEVWRKLKHATQDIQKKRNDLTAAIAKTKKEGGDASKLLDEAKKIPEELKKNEEELTTLHKRITDLLYTIPNIMADSVPIGKDESENVETGKFGDVPSFDFEPKNHVQLCEALHLADFEGASRVAGNGFYYLKGDLVRLNQAIIHFALNFLAKQGYSLVEPPLMLNKDHTLTVMPAQDFEEHAYKIDGKEQFLIATAEFPLVAWFKDQVIDKKQLPIKLAGYSMSFRQEIGSHGIEEKGLYRTHQFNKVEQVIICEPEDSAKLYDELLNNSVELYNALEIPIRTLAMCSGDLGVTKHKQEDVEAWSPIKKEYYEVGSCSNLTDNQARRTNIKVFDGETRYVPHTLNNTGIATSRCMIAILENNQQKDGSIAIPKALQPLMSGQKLIKAQ